MPREYFGAPRGGNAVVGRARAFIGRNTEHAGQLGRIADDRAIGVSSGSPPDPHDCVCLCGRQITPPGESHEGCLPKPDGAAVRIYRHENG